ncbi:MAG: LTA synthase family protein [Erysipelotrichaceae bacterium]|nr:LTA synthase family protein [Erysipelotrichaceae bacterium]
MSKKQHKKKKTKLRFNLSFLYLFIPMFLLETVFHFVQFGLFDIFTFLRIILFLLFLSIFIWFICSLFKKKKVYFIVGLIIMIWFSAYSFVELIFKNFMGDFYSFGTVSDGAGRIAQYALIFLSAAKIPYYFCFIGIISYLLLWKFVKFNDHGPVQLPLIVGILSFLLMIPCINLGSGVNSIFDVYNSFSNKTIIIDKMGIEHFFFRDLSALFYKAPEKIIIEDDPDDDPPVETVTVKKRAFDDSEWKAIAANEENSNMQTLDSYLMNRKITQPNEMTGKFEGYNFIYFMVEAFDYLAIDKDLTPTLYKMYTEGYSYYNHYTPLYSCATGESEWVSYTSIFPYVNTCTPNYVAAINYPHALGYLFKNEGYTTFGIHNWRDEFYERKMILPNCGIDTFYDIDDIWQDTSIQHTDGWQSDSMLIEQAIKHIKEINGPYFCDIITSVMHFPYEESTYWGDHYLDQINEIHPDWGIDYKRYMSKCMDFDHGLQILLDYLESSGQADNTIICIYPDHRPYWMDYDTVMEYTRWIDPNRFGENGIYRSPFIIYNKNLDGTVNYNYCSTLDHVPTIANLFDLNYDPRLYMGTDLYNGNNTVILANGNWITDKGWYDTTSETFYPNVGVEVDDGYVSKTNNAVQNTIRISYLILDEDYHQNRRSICYPKKIEE